MSKALVYVEIDVPVCTRSYGVAPCTASIGVTGSDRCYSTRATCQDRAHYNESEVTLRFAKPTEYLPDDIDCVPDILEVAFSPATISLGDNLGQRASLTVTFRDHPHSDTGPGGDPYVALRAYNAWVRGTYWGKFRARQPFLRGRSLRWITGYLGESLAAMATRHFVIESFDGPSPDGKYTLTAKDVLKLADDDRAQAPELSGGFLTADISDSATSASLSPSGIGNTDYPSSGYLALGGKEIVSYTRSGDALTMTRAQLGTEAAAHKAQDRVQWIERYVAEDPADIIYDLLVSYAGIDPAWINLADWQAETAAYLGRVYTANLCEPTGVNKLVSELIQQACLMVWWDDSAQKIRLQVLRPVVANAQRLTPDNWLQGTLTVREQPDKRLSQVWVYFAVINPLRSLSDADNYRSTAIVIDDDAEADYGSPVIEKIMSRWIPALGRTVADRLGAIRLGRFRDPPRRLTLETMRRAGTDLVLGSGYRIEGVSLQDASGAALNVPVQITRLNTPPDRFQAEAEEMDFDVPVEDLTHRLIVVDANINNVNLRTAHDSLYPAPVSGDTVTCRINAGVIVGASSTASPALDIGSWPAGVSVVLQVYGRIQGRGGDGGKGSATAGDWAGHAGGPALYTRKAINLIVASGQIWGGGGGGSAGYAVASLQNGGGGGAGQLPGTGGAAVGVGSSGADGTTEAGGAGATTGPTAGVAGDGGGPGLAGTAKVAAGGAAGNAIDGVSYITVVGGAGDVRGPQIN